MLFKNPASEIVPNFPVQTSIVDMQRQVAELHGELRAAGCRIVQNCGDLLIEVPAGVNVDPIMERHKEMFVSVTSQPGRLEIGGEHAETEI